MTSLSIPRISTRRAGTLAITTLGVAAVALSAAIVLVAVGAVLLSTLFSTPAAAPAGRGVAAGLGGLGALFFGAIAVAAVVEAVRLAATASRR